MENRFEYKTYTIPAEAGRLILVTDIHCCHAAWYGVDNADRMELLCKTLQEEFEAKPYDAILSLGDYSLDFWAWEEGGSYLWDPPVSRTAEFVTTYVPRMPADFYMIPGNHEQYGDKTWQKITGFPREYVILYGEYVFVMLDTFAGELDPTVNHDGCYTGINVELLTAVLRDHPHKKVILCAHDLYIKRESEAARELILEHPNILCAFTGHTHRDNTVILPDAWRNLPLIYCGDFSYCDGSRKDKNWGYRTLSLMGGALSTEYLRA
jgi:predicted phosphodiesterase